MACEYSRIAASTSEEILHDIALAAELFVDPVDALSPFSGQFRLCSLQLFYGFIVAFALLVKSQALQHREEYVLPENARALTRAPPTSIATEVAISFFDISCTQKDGGAGCPHNPGSPVDDTFCVRRTMGSSRGE